jgi:hypothetical protein
MDKNEIIRIFRAVQRGEVSPEDAFKRIRDLPFEMLDSSHIDHHREIRQGIPEVVLAEGKSVSEVKEISQRIYEKRGKVLITRASEEMYRAIGIEGARFHPRSRIIAVGESGKGEGKVLVLSAGTSDLPVAEEALLTARFLGSRVKGIFDVGVAGIHRLFAYRADITGADVIVVVAGMEGALPSVVGGLTDAVVIGVPTSTGYGASLGGLTALFSMLNSCVPGIAVMNIDNGFGAGCLAHRINMLRSGRRG